MADAQTQTQSATPAAPPPVTSEAPAVTPQAAPTATQVDKTQPGTDTSATDQGKPTASLLGDAPAVEAKPGEAKPQGEATPAEEIKITLPEGTKVDEHLLSGFSSFAKEAGLNNETANKVAAWYAGEVAKQDQAMVGAIERQSAEFRAAVEKDPELGGAHLPQTVQNIARCKREFGNAELWDGLKQYGLDNWPPLARLINAVGARFGEDDSSGGKSAPPAKGNDFMREVFGVTRNEHGAFITAEIAK